MYRRRIRELAQRLADAEVDLAIITDEDSVYYCCGYYDYLHMDFGRPTLLLVWRDGETLLITPGIDFNSALDLARVERIEAWQDGDGDEWRARLPAAVDSARRIAVEIDRLPPPVRRVLEGLAGERPLLDVTPIVDELRLVKSAAELELARHAGEVATAMMRAGREAIAPGVAEFEVALATAEAGTRKAAELLAAHYADGPMSPNTHFLQIMASGPQITRTHHRASLRVMRRGEPVFLCFCGMTNFHRFKLGFDRTFWIGELPDERQAALYRVALDSQAAALAELRPGAIAEDVHAAYAEVIRAAGFDTPFRCGRGTGYSFLERPQLVTGDRTVLRAGMVLAVDGSVSADGFRAQVGDSFIVTEAGAEPVTFNPKTIEEVIIS